MENDLHISLIKEDLMATEKENRLIGILRFFPSLLGFEVSLLDLTQLTCSIFECEDIHQVLLKYLTAHDLIISQGRTDAGKFVTIRSVKDGLQEAKK